MSLGKYEPKVLPDLSTLLAAATKFWTESAVKYCLIANPLRNPCKQQNAAILVEIFVADYFCCKQ